ncbi:histidine kinase dimerization/phospho-acceptor domain-containing protein, partial [Clostridium baratii]
MKLKLTFRYVFNIAMVAVIVVIINITMIYLLVNSQDKNNLNGYGSMNEITSFVRNFGKYIDLGKDNKLYINNNGKNLINQSNSWVQILDENNREVYSYNKPREIKDKHTPIDIINGYKYAGGLGGTSQILAGYKEIDNVTYTYLIGFPSNILKKYIVITEADATHRYIKYGIISIITVDFIIAIIFGYIFSKGITKPVKDIIDGVDNLYDGNYEFYSKEEGIYKNVFKKLNSLSYKLEENELERKKIDKMRSEWIANISHDIKTPLSSIKGYAEFLEQDYDFSSDDIKSYAEIINNKSDYIKELVDDLNLSMKL